MVKQKIKKMLIIFLVAGLLCVAMLLRTMVHRDDASLVVPLLRNAIHIGLLIAWSISVKNRVMQPQALRLLRMITGFMLFWFIIRLFKYEFVENPVLLRYLWYLYYVPMLFIPLCALCTAMLLGKSELAKLPKYAVIPTAISTVLCLCVMTNDVHQLVFSFPQEKPWSDSHYGYGPIYYSIVIWLLFCAVSFLVILLYKCRIPKNRKFIWLPAAPVLVLVVYTILYLLRVQWLFKFFGDLPAAFCLCYVAILESCMQTGLIQTNTGYDMLFEAATVRAQITDEDWNTWYHSDVAFLDAKTLLQAEDGPILLNRNTLLKTKQISGGHVAWQEDVTELANTLEQLEENQQELEDENFLEREALHTKQEMLHLQEKNRLYDLIGKYTRPQIELVDTLLKTYDRAEDVCVKRSILAKICVITAYIKRCGNLLLIRESSEKASVLELIKAMEESIHNLELINAECGLTCTIEDEISTTVMVEAYTFFEQMVQAAIDGLDYLWCNLRLREQELILRMELETSSELSDLTNAVLCRSEDGVWVVTACYTLGGEHQ